jgi:acyl carrier protein
MNEAEVRQKIRDYITRELIRDESYALTDSEGIITAGLMDSFALAELAVYIETAFNVYIPDPDLTVAKMDTLDQIVARVLRDQ